jgi:hypothetical protein
LTIIHSQWRQTCRALSEDAARLQREGGKIGAVLAPWDMGAHILYCTGLPVVASNYHRNIDGILDAYRVLLAGPAEEAEVWRILRQRDVRWIVAWYDHLFLHDGQVTLGRPPMAQYERDGFTLLPAAQRTLYWVLREAPQVPGLTLRGEGEVGFIGQRREPLFRLWEVR